MCTNAIVDTNLLSLLYGSTRDAELYNWICDGHGNIVYTEYKYSDCFIEIQQVSAARNIVDVLRRNGNLKLITDDEMKQNMIFDDNDIESDDPHIMALARAGDALVLCTGDQDLMKDFKNHKLLPKVGRRSRAIYPHKEEQKTRRSFLQQRECDRR